VDYLVYLAVRVVVCVTQALSLETGHQLAKFLAWFFAEVLRIRRKVVDDNLCHAFPEMTPGERRRLARGMWEHLFLLVFEVAQAPRRIHEHNWRQFLKLRDVEPLMSLILARRPVVIVTAHFGNFELGGYLLGLLGFPTFTVARNLDNPYLDDFVERFRGATGQTIIPKNGGYDQIVAALAAGGTMTLLADQYAGPKGCWVQFFNRPASAHKAIGLLSLDYDAPIAICSVRRLDKPLQFEMRLWEVLDPRDVTARIDSIRDLTQWYTAKLEEMIREAPEQYWWLHRRWKDTRPPKKSVAKAA
jgi:KDO2-lipid IV(A) lauroyltransferase